MGEEAGTNTITPVRPHFDLSRTTLSDLLRASSAPLSLKSLMVPVHVTHLVVPISGDHQIKLIADDLIWRYSRGTEGRDNLFSDAISDAKYGLLAIKYGVLLAAAYVLLDKF